MEYIKSKTISKLLPVVLALTLSIFAIFPLLKPGFFPVHDNTQVQRVFEMRQSLGQGMFPVRWVNDLGYGYGYPIFNYYAPLPYYFGGITNLAGLDSLTATKLMFIFPILLSGLTMYFLGKEFWGKPGGVLSSIFYVLAPYHAVNIYVRGDIGEIWAYSIFPLIFLSLYKIYREKSWRYVALGSLSYALLIVSHNLSAFIATPFMFFAALFISYSFIKTKQINEVFKLISVFFIGLLIASFYFIPALLELKFTNVSSIIGGGSDFRDHFVCFNQLWSSPWGFGGSNPGCIDGLSLKIGKLHILLALIAFGFSGWAYIKRKKFDWNLMFLFVGLFASVLMTLEISKPLWIIFKSMEFVQFPWRYLSLASFFISLLAGSVFIYISTYIKDKNIRITLVVLLILALIVSGSKIFNPQRQISYESSYYTSPEMIKWTTSKISDEYLPQNFKKPESLSQIPFTVNPGLPGPTITDNSRMKEIAVSMPEAKRTIFNLAYFPAWKGYIDYKEVPLFNESGRVGMQIPEGLHLIDLNYTPTAIERNSDTLSIIGIVALVAVIILSKHERRNKKNT